MTETVEAQVFLMTDKDKTKDCQCVYAGCFNICRVNKFYAPSKAHCPKHGGEAFSRRPSTVDGEISFEPIDIEQVDTVAIEVHPNHKVRSLMCPVCDVDEPLEILACTDDGHIDFGCQGCQTVVSIAFNWRSAQLRSIPDGLRKVVKKFNIRQVGSMDAAVAHQLSGFGSYRV